MASQSEAAAPKPKKKSRRCCTDFDPQALVDAWLPLARLKNCGFDWTGADYQKVRRSQGPDRDGLSKYAGGLSPLADLVPSGFPRHTTMKRALKMLDSIIPIKPEKACPAWADAAADKWCLMLKHLWEENKSPKTSGLFDLADAMAKLSGHGIMDVEAQACGQDQVEAQSDSDVVIMGFKCNCNECNGMLLKDGEELDSTSKDGYGMLLKDGEELDSTSKDGKELDSTSKDGEESDSSIAARQAPTLQPTKGSQKRTLKAAQEEKAAQAATTKVKKKAQLQATRKAKKEAQLHAKKEAQLQAADIQPNSAVKLVVRNKPLEKQECYLLVGQMQKYLVSCRKKQSANYMDIIKQVKKSVEDGTITSKAAALSLRDKLINDAQQHSAH